MESKIAILKVGFLGWNWDFIPKNKIWKLKVWFKYWNYDFITEIKIWKRKFWFKYWNLNFITEIRIWKLKFWFKHFNWDFKTEREFFLNWNCDWNIEIMIGWLKLGSTPLTFHTLKVREIYFQTQHGSSGYLIIKNFYFQYRISGKQRTGFRQICQESLQGKTKKDSSCGYITPVSIGFL